MSVFTDRGLEELAFGGPGGRGAVVEQQHHPGHLRGEGASRRRRRRGVVGRGGSAGHSRARAVSLATEAARNTTRQRQWKHSRAKAARTQQGNGSGSTTGR